ncbi:tyrosine-protein phosphatase 10D isoform X3 [Vespa velutina]|nr:tyrosine-protein phosphatase 10D isoform X3 [Vespa velutina]
MIPKKRLQLLLYILRVFYVFGEEDTNERNTNSGIISNVIREYSFFDKNENLSNNKTEVDIDMPTKSSITSENYEDDEYDEWNFSQKFNKDSLEIHFDLCEQTNASNGMVLEIEDVKHLMIEAVDTERILISWMAPCSAINNILINYTIVTYSYDQIKKTEDISNTLSYIRYNVTGLNPCTPYTFEVFVNAGHNRSNGYNTTGETSSNLTYIEDVLNLRINEPNNVKVEDIDDIGMELTWDAPEKYIKCIDYYKIIQCIKNSCNENNTSVSITNTTSYIIWGLEPCTEYFYTVKIISSSSIESPGKSIYNTTRTITSSEPQSLNAEPGDFSLSIHWLPPLIGYQCVQKYNITVSFNTLYFYEKCTTNTSEVITDLHACTSYMIHVIPINKVSLNGNLATTKGKTNKSITESPVVHASKCGIYNISMTWCIKKVSNNNCTLKSIIVMCNYVKINGHGYLPKSGEVKKNLDEHIKLPMLENITVTDLSPYTKYSCQGIIVNEAGNSSLSEPVNVTTLEDSKYYIEMHIIVHTTDIEYYNIINFFSVSSPPIIKVKNITDTRFTLFWQNPIYLPGILTAFEIKITWHTLFERPDWCTNDTFGTVIISNITGTSLDYLNGKPYTNYTVSIKGRTAAGWSDDSKLITFVTSPGVPGIVSNISHIIKKNENDDQCDDINNDQLDTVVTWDLPCFLNGKIESFFMSVHGIRNGYDPHIFSIKKNYSKIVEKNYVYSMVLPSLKSEYNYTLNISAKVRDVETWSLPASYGDILYPAKCPPEPDEEYVKSISIDPYKARRSTTSVTILLPLFSNDNGLIKYYAIMVSKKGFNVALNNSFNVTEQTWPDTPSWEESMNNDFSLVYQATGSHWHPFPNYVADYGHIKAVKYVLGEDTACKEISSNTNKRLYCNGPLKSDTWYDVRMRAFTSKGFRDSPAFLIKTNAELNVGVVIGIVLGILFLGILTTMMLLVRRCSPYTIFRQVLNSDMPGSPLPTPFTRKKFLAHCQELIDNPGKLSNEFRLLQTLSVDLQMPTNTACLQANRKKNRYSDILPYDFSRVKLEVIDNDPNTDYINASFVKGYSGEDEYIACQGPKEDTIYDFWRMIDQYEINIIVMLTQLIEKGKVKCHQYYPTIRETFGYENITIRCTSELDFRTYTQRTLILQKENKKKTITHLHFKDWPDHDVPEDFDSMINFCQIMRRNIGTNKGFVVIHCSAGIGRTGTLIAIDILLQYLRDNRKLDVFGTVYRLRHYRINMVQRESQYTYIYNCIMQVLKNPYFLKTYKPPHVDPMHDNNSKSASETTNSDGSLTVNLETCM